MIQSRKMAEVAELPLKLNLQLFAEGDPEPTEPTEPIEPASPPAEPTEPQEPSEPTLEPENKAEPPEAADPDQKPRQDPDTNKAFQDMRHKVQEMDRQLKERDAWVEKNYGQHGLKTWEDYQRQVDRERDLAYYEEKGVDPNVVEEIVDKKLQNHPEVVKARQLQIKAYESEQMTDLNKRYGLDVKTFEDVKSLPNGSAMVEKIMNGYEWHEAYLITHYDQVQQKAAETARQAARNNQDSKAHLKTPTGGGDVDTFVMPPDTLAEYRRMFAKEYRSGKMTDKDFTAHYRKSQGK